MKLFGRWALRAGAIVVGLATLGALALKSRAPPFPSELSDDTVVAVLGSSQLSYPAELREAAKRMRAAPGEPAAAIEAARLYLDYGRSIGNARFAGAALGALQPFLDKTPGPALLNLAASAHQYMHRFDEARALLDQTLKLDPHNAQALLSRANILIVQGRLSEASSDCIGLLNARRQDLAILCDTTVRALSVDAPQAYERLDRLVAINAIDPALHGYAQSLLAEIARFQDWPDKARANFTAARAEDPEDLRTLMIFADFEIAQGRPREALALLKDIPATDGIMVRQAIAFAAIGDTAELTRLKQILRARFEAAAALGETEHAREAARYWLDVEHNAAAALAAAETNWVHQKELEDALLLIASAIAANRPQAARPVERWAAVEGVVAPTFRAAMAQAKNAGTAP